MDKYGLLGEKLGHSLSPKIHSLIFQYTYLSGEYDLFPAKKEDLPNIIEKVRNGEIKGLNVTIPYKTEVIKYLDVISEEARFIGAVNTIYLRNKKLVGANTDSFGFKYTLEISDIEVEGKRVAVLGTGGASKSIVFVLKNMGAQVDVYSRTPNENQKAYVELEGNHNYDIIVNTTPVGMYPNIDEAPIKEDCIDNAYAVIDIVYNPIDTKLLSYAKNAGKKHVNGMYMLVGQAVKAQEIFNSIKIDKTVIQKIYDKVIGEI